MGDWARTMHAMGSLAASGIIWGPALFIAAWVAAGQLLPGYSPLDQHISSLAALDVPTRPLMDAGFVVSAIGALSAAWPVRRVIGIPAATALALNGVATLGVWLNPLGGSAEGEFQHAMAAVLAYLTLAAIGPLSARVLGRGNRWFAVASVLVGFVTFVALALSLGDSFGGGFQRIGLTTTGLWLMVVGVAIVRDRLSESPGARGSA